MDEQWAKMTIEGTPAILAGLAHILYQNNVCEGDAELVKGDVKGTWRLTFTISPEYVLDEDQTAEWFTNVRTTHDIGSFEPLDGCIDPDEG